MDIYIDNPDFIITCSKLKTSVEIYDVFHENQNPKVYVYTIAYLNGFKFNHIKIGESAPDPGKDTSEAIGERVKRQLEHVPGWEDPPYYSNHGDDFWTNVSREINNGNLPIITKDNLYVGVWNLDIQKHKIDFLYNKNKNISLYAEGLLCEQYKVLNDNRLPILNIKDPTRNYSFKGPKFYTSIWEQPSHA